MKIIHLLILTLALAGFAVAQEAPVKKKKTAPMNASTEPVTGKIYIVKAEKNRFTVTLDQPLITPTSTNKVVAFYLAEGGNLTLNGASAKLVDLQKGMKVRVVPTTADAGKASEVEVTGSGTGAEKTEKPETAE